MTTITNQGIITSFSNSAQALNDQFNLGITEDSGAVILNVMANDKGGNAKTLWSLDGSGPTGLLAQDLVEATNFSKFGATIKITSDGKVSYNASTSTHLQTLAAGQSATDTFTYAIQLGNGTLSWATASVQITGTNDAPVITSMASMAQSSSVTEDTTLTASGTVTSSDVDNGATATYSGNASSSYGSFAVAASTGVWTYTLANAAAQSLAAGETKTETFAVTVTDEHGATATQDVVITITGTNDAPVITSAAQAGSVTEDTTLTASGIVTSSDVDNGATATYSGNASSSYGSFAVAASTGVWTYTLNNAAHQSMAAGEIHNETFTVTVTDDQGATATQDVVITITGTNDAPVITSAAQSGTVKEDTTLTASGTVASSDVDNGATAAYSGNASGSYGSFAVTASGVWTYTLDNGAAQALNADQTVTETFAVTVTDDQGATATQDVVITITGTNDAPVQVVASLPTVFEGGGDPNDNDGLGLTASQTLTGDNAANTLYGGAGNDTLVGKSGSDTLYGGSGNDSLAGDAHNDMLYGGSGNDTISGGGGDDTIIGGFGADSITGGGGADKIVYLSLLDTGDTITGFNSEQVDKIDLSAIDANNAAVGDQAFAWGGQQDGAFVLANSVTWYTTGGNVIVLADTDGDLTTAEFSITLLGVTNLALTDFNTL